MTVGRNVRPVLNKMSANATVKGEVWKEKNPPTVVICDAMGMVRQMTYGVTSHKRTYFGTTPPQKTEKETAKEKDAEEGEEDGEDDDSDDKQPKQRSPIYFSREFLDADEKGVPLLPLYNEIFRVVRAWFLAGVKTVVMCFDKGTPGAKKRTAKKREQESNKRGEFAYKSNVQMTSTGSLFEVDEKGVKKAVEMDYERIMVSRRLRNQTFEWFAEVARKADVFPPDGTLWLDYVDLNNRPVALKVNNGKSSLVANMVNSHGEGDVAILNWLHHYQEKSVLVTSIDGDMYPILTFQAVRNMAAAAAKKNSESALYWVDGTRVADMHKFVACVCAAGSHPIALALFCVLSTNDFFLPEDKQKVIPRVAEQHIWNGLCKVPYSRFENFQTFLEVLHAANKGKTAAPVPDAKKMTTSGASTRDTTCATFITDMQTYIITNKEKELEAKKKAKAAESGKTTTTRSSSSSKKKQKKRDPIPQDLCRLIVGNIEYWVYGKSVIAPALFTVVVGGIERNVTHRLSDAERDVLELSDLARVVSV